MKIRILRKMVVIFILFFVYRNRYRLLNSVLQHESIRKFVVSCFMSAPFVRNRMIISLFPKKMNLEKG